MDKKALFTVPVKVRYYDTDLSRAVFFTNYIKWFDSIALPEFTEALGVNWQDFLKDNIDVVVVRSAFDYKAQCFLNDRINVAVTDVELGRSSMTLFGALFRGETLVAEGKVIYVFIDLSTKKARPVPESFKDKLAVHIKKIRG